MRVLVVSDEYPWPARTGYRQRLAAILRTLTAEHEVDLVTVLREDQVLEPAPVSLREQLAVVAGARTEHRAQRLARWLTGDLPRILNWRDWTPARDALTAWLARHGGEDAYDVVWFSHPETHQALADLVPGPHVVDLDNLNSELLAHRRRRTPPTGTGLRERGAAVAARTADRVDERRWRRIERACADRAAVAVVCSGLDRDRLHALEPGAAVRVVPNGYEPAPGITGGSRTPRSEGPVLLMVGLLTYEANQDAAAFFGRDVLPLVRAQAPAARFRVVGRYAAPDVARFAGLPGLELTGEVADLGAELAAADVAVVPIRFGGGTRIKILEAFATGLPVVATSVGAEGLDVVGGRHLLLADDAESFAEACLRVWRDPVLRESLVAEGRARWQERYRWDVIAPTITAAVAEAAEPAAGRA